MSRLSLLNWRWLACVLLSLLPLFAEGHSSPSLTVEAVFGVDKSYTLLVNIDPRLVLSNQPATLPPVEAQWYRAQNANQLKATESSAVDYLTRALGLRFSGADVPLPTPAFVPIDGGSNEPLGTASKEVHLLAEMHGQVPAGASTFQVVLGAGANASMILINSLAGKTERRPSVVFPGETSRAFSIEMTGAPPPVQAGGRKAEEDVSSAWRSALMHFEGYGFIAHFMLCIGLALARPRVIAALGLWGGFELVHWAAAHGWVADFELAADVGLALAGVVLVGLAWGRRLGWILAVVVMAAVFHGLTFGPSTGDLQGWLREGWILEKNGGLALIHLTLVLVVCACRGLWRAARAAGATVAG